jgi:hypothetical protein
LLSKVALNEHDREHRHDDIPEVDLMLALHLIVSSLDPDSVQP